MWGSYLLLSKEPAEVWRTDSLHSHRIRNSDISHLVVQSLSCVQFFVTTWTAAQLSFPSPTPGACSNSCPLSRWCHPCISSSVTPFSSRLLSFSASGSYPMSQFFTLGAHSTGASASASVLPINIQGLFPLRLTGWISLQSKGFQESSSNPQFKSINSSVLSFLMWAQLSHK